MKSTAAMDGDYPGTGRSTHAPRADVQTLIISGRRRARWTCCALQRPTQTGAACPVYLSAGGGVPPAPRCRWSVWVERSSDFRSQSGPLPFRARRFSRLAGSAWRFWDI